MSKHPSFNEVVQQFVADGYGRQLPIHQKRMCEFFGRWQKNKSERQQWEHLADKVEKYGVSRKDCFYLIALSGVHALNVATLSIILKERQLQLNRLARHAQYLADYYGNQADHVALARCMQEEAESFRRLASPENFEGLRLSPRSGGKHHTREQLVFMVSCANSMQRYFDTPHNEVVAAITGIAYPKLAGKVTAEHVRDAYGGKHRPERFGLSAEREAGKNWRERYTFAAPGNSTKLSFPSAWLASSFIVTPRFGVTDVDYQYRTFKRRVAARLQRR